MPGKASSRGKEAVQAAAAAARAAAAAIAAEQVAPAAQELDEEEELDDVALLEGNTAVLDLKGICAIGTNPDEPIRSFRMLLLPSTSVRVPHCPGNYVVSTNTWSNLTFPCWVSFVDSLKRKDELAVAVLDYSRVNPDLDLISIESLPQPIRVRNNVYKSDKECRITKISSIKGFRAVQHTIDEGGIVGPWSEQYGPYKELKITDWFAVHDFCNQPIRSRLPLLVELAHEAAARAAEESAKQCRRTADIALALKTAHINKLESKLAAVNLESYDKSLESRVTLFDADSTNQLRTPERGSMSAGTARIVTTRFAEVVIAIDDAADEAAAPAAASEAGGSGVGSEPLRDVEEVDEEVEKDAAAAVPAAAPAPANGKSSRPPPMPRRERPKKTSRYEPEPLDGGKPDGGTKRKRSAAAAPAGADNPEVVLLNRDGEPYKRGGPYRQRKGKQASSSTDQGGPDDFPAQPRARAGRAAAADSAATTAEATALRTRIASLETALDAVRAENHALEREKGSLHMQLKSQAETMELRMDAVKAKVVAEYQTMLHSQFMQGLATGSAMASQGAMQVPGVQPYSFGGGGSACPSARSASFGSFPNSGMASD